MTIEKAHHDAEDLQAEINNEIKLDQETLAEHLADANEECTRLLCEVCKRAGIDLSEAK